MITLSQTAYINVIVTWFKLQDGFKVGMPMDMSVILSKKLSPVCAEEQKRMKQIPYLSAVGSLMYASMATCPDITYAMSHLGKYSANHGQAHWMAAQ